jgi:nucleoside-diphosphate-sugar epimerase
MKVFITGASGYVGSHVAGAFRRAGHEVWGLVRSEAKGLSLARNEIRTAQGTLQEPDSWLALAQSCSVLVHCASDASGGDPLTLDRTVVQALINAADEGPRPKTFLYTSGVWVYGDTGGRLVDETAPLKPLAIVAPRAATEKLVLRAPGVRGLVIRPGCLYGGRGGMTGGWFAGSEAGDLQVVGDGRNRWAMVHADDVADAYVRAAESGERGEIFHVTDRSRATVGDMAEAAAQAAGYAGAIRFLPAAEARKTMGGFTDALIVDQHVDSRKAVSRLGWQPKHGGFCDDAASYYAAWKAAQKPA